MDRIKIIFTLFLYILFFNSNAQNIGLNNDGSNADNSAILDIKSTNKGFLIPRMTSIQRNAIVSPGESLIVYDLDSNSLMIYIPPDGWKSISPTLTINNIITGNASGDILEWNGTQWQITPKCNLYVYVYRDADSDGYGNKYIAIPSCGVFPGFVPDSTDRNDTDITIYPGAIELCDNKDNNQDNQIDEAFPLKGTACTVGVGACQRSGVWICNGLGTGLVCSATPGSPTTETCDGVDNDCDGLVDEGLTRSCYSGASGTSGVGACRPGTQTCTAGSWGACVGQVTPIAEICDGIDNNCNGTVDETWPTKGTACTVGVGACQRSGVWICNGLGTGLVCSATPGSPTTETCDGIDNNCNGTVDETWPTKGTACTVGVGACQRSGVWICNGLGTGLVCSATPGSPTTETCDGVDNDCDGLVDEGLTRSCYSGASGTSGVGACRPGTQTCTAGSWGACVGQVTPIAEICDGIDNNCNGTVDETWPTKGTACTVGVGACQRSGVWICNGLGTGLVCSATPGSPTTETCDGVDNDCDGLVDEGLTRSCYSGASGTSGVGACRPGTQTCTAGSWGACVGQVTPIAEICDGIDNNCNGTVDETWPTKGNACTVGVGACQRSGVWICNGLGTGLVCSATPGSPTTETCDGIDNNCNGTVDETWPTKGTSCIVGVGACQRSGVWICNGLGTGLVCSATPGSPTTETCDGVDNNCDGLIDNGLPVITYYRDADGDSYGNPFVTISACSMPSGYVANNTDCNDANNLINPGRIELCNSIDDNCTGTTDEAFPLKGTACTVGVGACQRSGVWICNGLGTGLVCSATPGVPTAEICNGIDDDCNGIVDGITRSCYTGPGGTSGVGACRPGTQTCTAGSWGACVGQVTPIAEICDGIDNNCNGTVDETWPTKGTACTVGVGACQRSGVLVCNGLGTGLVCTATPGSPTTEICNNIDDNCNGVIDDGLTRSCYTGPVGTAGVGRCRTGTQNCSAGLWGACTGEVLPIPEIIGNGIDDNCDGVVN